MSILDRLSLNRHLDDAALTEIWTAAALDPAGARRHGHLDVCPSCRSRYAALDAWLADVGHVARAEADEAFPAERLATQQNQIMRRLESLDRPARVIVFPRHSHPMTGERSGARRWIAAAAAAGLVVGIAAGQLLDLRDALGGPPHSIVERPQLTPSSSASASLQPASLVQSDEAFLSELEDAALSPRIPELVALDAVTPRLRDIGNEMSQ